MREYQRRGVTVPKHVVREGFSEGFTEKILFKQILKENEGISNVNIWRRALQTGPCSTCKCPIGGACLGCHHKLAQTGNRRQDRSGPYRPPHGDWLFL